MSSGVGESASLVFMVAIGELSAGQYHVCGTLGTHSVDKISRLRQRSFRHIWILALVSQAHRSDDYDDLLSRIQPLWLKWDAQWAHPILQWLRSDCWQASSFMQWYLASFRSGKDVLSVKETVEGGSWRWSCSTRSRARKQPQIGVLAARA